MNVKSEDSMPIGKLFIALTWFISVFGFTVSELSVRGSHTISTCEAVLSFLLCRGYVIILTVKHLQMLRYIIISIDV